LKYTSIGFSAFDTSAHVSAKDVSEAIVKASVEFYKANASTTLTEIAYVNPAEKADTDFQDSVQRNSVKPPAPKVPEKPVTPTPAVQPTIKVTEAPT
jgi:hypothetical protein